MPMDPISTKPYLIRAIHAWCTDQGFTPYMAVVVDAHTKVPGAYVQDGQIVLNIGFEATQSLSMENDWISFQARFGGITHGVAVPISNVAAIYARENGHGTAFDVSALQTPERDAGDEVTHAATVLGASPTADEAPARPPFLH
jgi:stringent starvation protein B